MPDHDLPLFPTSTGGVCTKAAVTATLVAAADLLKVPRAAPDGTERISGHTLRATGAQGLAKAGLELWAIQLLGRWGSDSVRLYVREAHLARSEEWARRALQTRSLTDLAAAAAPQVAARTREGEQLHAAVEQVCVELGASAASAGQPAADIAAQLATPILVEADGEFAPPPVDEQARRTGADEELARGELATAIVVLNLASGVAHRAVAETMGEDSSAATAGCGWKFGKTPEIEFPSPDAVARDHKRICGKCFPRWRALLKAGAASRGAGPPSEDVGGAARASARARTWGGGRGP